MKPERKQTFIYRSLSGAVACPTPLTSNYLARVVVRLRPHIGCPASYFFHGLQLQPVVVLSLRPNLLATLVCLAHLSPHNPTYGSLPTQLRFN